jgi:orotidine-5'-phosphate decarboxylase
MTSFRDKWLEAVDKKNSVLCAGLDPADIRMGRGDKGLSEEMVGSGGKGFWSGKYLEAIAPFCAAVKPNIQYWKEAGDMMELIFLTNMAHDLGMVVIEDSKLADIGSTNDAGIYHASKKEMDAVTFSPFAGNLEEASKQAHDRELGLVSMCLMSNPDFKKIKNMWADVSDDVEAYGGRDSTYIIRGTPFVKYYMKLARDAERFGTDGIVIGAPSKKNHLAGSEIAKARSLVGDNMLVLLPGVGAQGGEAGEIWKYFGKDNVIVNVGRSLMLPNGSNSTPEQQMEAAKHYQEMLNDLRTAA